MAHRRTWVFTRANQSMISTGSVLASYRTMWRTIKNDLLVVPGATIRGSSNSTVMGLDGVDRWASDANLIWGDPGDVASSWVIITFANMGGAQLLIWLNGNGSGFTDGTYTVLDWSPHGLFTTTTLAEKPTASDSAGLQYVVNPSSSAAHLLSTVYTTDGAQARIMRIRLALDSFVAIGVIDDTISGNTGPHGFMASDSDGSVFQRGAVDENPYNIQFWSSATSEPLAALAYLPANAFFGLADGTLEMYSNRYPAWPTPVVAYGVIPDTSTGNVHRPGTIVDQYWTTEGLTALGDVAVMPDGSTYRSVGNLLIAWDGLLYNHVDDVLGTGTSTRNFYVEGECSCPTTELVVTPPTPIPAPVAEGDPGYLDHVQAAWNRLCEQFKAKSS